MASRDDGVVKVVLTVEVDGRTLRFEEHRMAHGTRLYGQDPAPLNLQVYDTFEDAVCVAAAACMDRATRRAEFELDALFPVAPAPDRVRPAQES